MFGPKVGGAFYQNLNENYDPLTMDRWFMRTIGRLTGDLVNEDEALDRKQANRFREALQSATPEELERFGVDPSVVRELRSMTDDDLYPVAVGVHKVWGREDYKKKTEMSSSARTWNDSAMNDSPTSPAHRGDVRALVDEALVIVNKDRVGEPIVPGDVQAIVWYPEKDLYREYNATSAKGSPNDYEQAINKYLTSSDGRRDVRRSGGTRAVQAQTSVSSGFRKAGLTDRARRRLARAAIAREISLTNYKSDEGVSPYQSPRAYKPRGGGDTKSNVRADESFDYLVAQHYSPDQKYANAMKLAGVATPTLHELNNTQLAAIEFEQRVRNAQKSQGHLGQHMTVYSPLSTAGCPPTTPTLPTSLRLLASTPLR
jgi:hypothetical protein